MKFHSLAKLMVAGLVVIAVITSAQAIITRDVYKRVKAKTAISIGLVVPDILYNCKAVKFKVKVTKKPKLGKVRFRKVRAILQKHEWVTAVHCVGKPYETMQAIYQAGSKRGTDRFVLRTDYANGKSLETWVAIDVQ